VLVTEVKNSQTVNQPGVEQAMGRGADAPQISMQCDETRPLPPPHFLMASLYMVQQKFGDSGTMDSLSVNLRPIYYSYSDHSLKENFNMAIRSKKRVKN